MVWVLSVLAFSCFVAWQIEKGRREGAEDAAKLVVKRQDKLLMAALRQSAQETMRAAEQIKSQRETIRKQQFEISRLRFTCDHATGGGGGEINDDIKAALKFAMKKAHPDAGGTNGEFQRYSEIWKKWGKS